MRTQRFPYLCALIIYAVLFACQQPTSQSQESPTNAATASQSTEAITIKVALYPYVPRLDQFKTVLAQQWPAVAPEGVAYELVDWDCYSSEPPADLDVFVFDAIYFDDFHSKGFLKKMEIDPKQKDDIIPFFLQGGMIGDEHYGLPQLGCANLLFYRKSDEALAKADSLDQFAKILGKAAYTTAKPPNGVGLLTDMSGGTTDSCLYIEAALDLNGQYTTTPKLPTSDELNPKAVANLQEVLCMSGKATATYEPDPYVAYQRAIWFGEGSGRAAIGFSESMSVMAKTDDVAFKLFPYASPDDLNLFYTDLVGINANVSENKAAAAQAMANLLSSANFFNAISRPTADAASPQYLMPVHHSSFKELGKDFPLYTKLYTIVESPNSHVLRLGPGSRDWLTNNKKAIQTRILDTTCN